MQSLIFYLLVLAVFCAKSSHTYNCYDRYCSVTVNDQKERIFNCSSGTATENFVTCNYFKNEYKLVISNVNGSYVKIDKIAPGALKRLVSGITVKKFYFSKFQVANLEASDFDGLTNILEMRIENPLTLASNTFLEVTKKTGHFILTLSCVNGNTESSFSELFLRSIKWILYTEFCKQKHICEYASCGHDSELQTSRILSSNDISFPKSRLSSGTCKINSSCNSLSTKTTKTIPKSKVPRPTASSIVEINEVTSGSNSSKSDDHYDSLLVLVFCLTGINSIVIMGILFFLLIWWKKLTTSNANQKHTIVLEDEDDTKFLKINPYT